MMINQFATDMGPVRMAIFAGNIPFHSRDGYAAPGNHMIAGLVAGLASEIQSPFRDAHVDIMISVGFGQNGAHVAVFDRIGTAASKMSICAAVVPAGPPHIFGYFDQMHIFCGNFFCGNCLHTSGNCSKRITSCKCCNNYEP